MELWYIPYYGQCRIYIINRILAVSASGLRALANGVERGQFLAHHVSTPKPDKFPGVARSAHCICKWPGASRQLPPGGATFHTRFALGLTHRPLSSSLLWFIFRIL